MAVLSDSRRQAAWADFMNELSVERDSTGILKKADLREAVNGLDDFFESNRAAMNQAMPEPARSNLTQKQKAKMAIFVIQQRYLAEA